jgi:hypothetical protein
MKVGDLVKHASDDADGESGFFSGIGIVLGFKPRGWSRDPDPECDVWNDAVVYWPGFGVGYNMRAMLEVIT